MMQHTIVSIQRMTPTAIIPTYGSDEAAGLDLYADDFATVYPYSRNRIRTGIALALPPHLGLLICPRSGLSSRYGITVHNGPGVIDADYRNGIDVILHNTTGDVFKVEHGDRIAQGLIVPVFRAIFREEELPPSKRGKGGFGSTGVKLDRLAD